MWRSVMIISFKNILFILIILTTSTSLYGWSFFKNDKTPKERLVVKLENESSTKFSELAKLRQHCKEEYTILSRLKIEKDKEIVNLSERLSDEYGIYSDKSYSYNSTNMTLYLVVTNNPNASISLEKAREFKNESESVEFLRLLTARNITNRQIQSINEMLKEKEIEFNKIVTYLENHFGVDRNKKYRFDENTGNLYDVGLFIDEKTSPVNKEKKVKSSDK